MKTCSKCGESKHVSAFNKAKAAKDGIHTSCRDCMKSYNKAWHVENKAQVAVRKAAAHKKNPKKNCDRSLKWYYENHEKALEKSRKWHIDNPERSSKFSALRREKYPEEKRASEGRRRTHKAMNGINLVTDAETAAITAMPCIACKASSPSEIDHIIPLVRGGAHTIGNLMPLCKSCNASKRDLLYIEWKYSKRPQAQKAFASP